MAEDKIEIISMGKSPVHEAMDWLVVYEFLCKQLASAFGVPPELLTPSNKGLQSDSAVCTCKVSMPSGESTLPICRFCGKPQSR